MDTAEIKQNEYYKILDEIMHTATVQHKSSFTWRQLHFKDKVQVKSQVRGGSATVTL